MKDGILNINKPAGWTSQDVCAKLRSRLHIKRIGHTGTLDPMATGVLPVCIGKATRIIEYYDDDFKTYHACMKLGATSDTLDIWGEILEEKNVRIISGYGIEDIAHSDDEKTEAILIRTGDIKKAFADYTGRVSQIPPKYSALKINGKRAYDLAREGKDFEIKAREITILKNEITALDTAAGTIEFDVTCSKGTYIRTICDDIGRALGCGAIMTSLIRTESGCFDIAYAVDLTELLEMSDQEIEDRIIPMDKTLINLGIIELNDNRFTAFINGNSSGTGYRVVKESHFSLASGQEARKKEMYRVYNRNSFLGTAFLDGRELVPAKVIFR